ncbi:hypothetical protein EJC51_00560 [Streptomyces aquilus]|uniref:Uncharacterized protein n=1 Tax=Streptomyces aquilus TaxID=2548456 RepID=A0A3S5HMD8_9ACTN|nr:hypothetical protein EJC51_00560 [Streptomyces aquilus]
MIVLDNAADAEQVRPLLPGTRGCRALITSRRPLPDLGAAARYPVPVLAPGDSLELLRATAGAERVAMDIPAVQQIADLLGHLPLALSLIGHHMRDHPAWTLGDYYREPLLTLALEDGVRTALAASDTRLPKGARRLLRLSALHPLEELDAATATALLGKPATVTEYHLATLTTAHLIQRTASGGFQLHPLTHAYAEERICVDEPATHIRQALARLLEHSRGRGATVRLGTRTLHGFRLPMPRQHAEADVEPRLPQQRGAGRVLAA